MGVLRGLIFLVALGLLVFSVADLVLIDNGRVKHLPKFVWVVVVIVLPILGPILWLTLGRERLAPEGPDANNWEPERTATRTPPPRRRRGPGGPDDDPEFLDRLRREREQQERIRQLEQRLAELDDDGEPKS